jgi:hypothetical protein
MNYPEAATRFKQGKFEHGYQKTFESENGAKVAWFNAVETTTIEPGIYIRLINPDNEIEKEEHFSFAEEEKAEEKYQEFVATATNWKIEKD